MYTSGDDLGAIVADIGACTTRIGFAGEDMPKIYTTTAVGVLEGSKGKELFYDADSYYRENMAMESYLSDGVMSGWDTFEGSWEHYLHGNLRIDTKHNAVLFSEKSFNSPRARQKLCEIMFEKFSSPAMFISKDAVLSCYACGKTSGLVVDVGYSGTTVTPVIDGWAEQKGLNRSIAGGRAMDAYTLLLMRQRGLNPLPLFRLMKTIGLGLDKRINVAINPLIKHVHQSYDIYMNLLTAKHMKETVARAAESKLTELDMRYSNIPLIPYELPDGTVVDVGIERFQIPELLFDTAPIDKESELFADFGISRAHCKAFPSSYDPIQSLACDSVLRCDPESHAALLGNLVVTGGSASIDGVPERIRSEVEHVLHHTAPAVRVRLMTPGASERPMCTWLGGSILASLGSFHEMWMSCKEYSESGAQLIDRKCP